jgi:predicted TIM-barrel fold metal-dependent hydrolase
MRPTRHSLLAALALGVAACAPAIRTAPAPSRPLVDHHQHLFSAATHERAPSLPLRSARDLIAQLDSVGIRRAVILSMAYGFAREPAQVPNEIEKVRAENDWTAAQVAQYPECLRAFCSVNPLRDYAVEEIARCATDPYLRTGLKLHFGASDVQLEDTAQLARVRRAFRAANEHRMAIVVHMHASVSKKRAYGARNAEVFLNDLIPAAPDVPVQIAHLGGAGGYDEPAVDSIIAVFVQAVAQHDPRMAHVYFDISGGVASSKERHALIVQRLRELGLARILYGSDAAGPVGGEYASFRGLPLTDAEFRRIESNVAPYMR